MRDDLSYACNSYNVALNAQLRQEFLGTYSTMFCLAELGLQDTYTNRETQGHLRTARMTSASGQKQKKTYWVFTNAANVTVTNSLY